MSDITKKVFVVRLPEDLLKVVDERAKARGISRNEWFTRMTKWVLANKP